MRSLLRHNHRLATTTAKLRPARASIAAAASAMGLEIRLLNASTITEIDSAFATLAAERPDALFISSGPFFFSRRVQLAHLATRLAHNTL
jgi:putative tryptophan/tyrosine transport system substrate-binding protein